MDGGSVAELTHSLVAAVEGLQAADLSVLGSADVTQLVTVLEVQRRKLAAVDQRVLAEVGERGLAGDYAATSTTDLLVALLRVSPAEAKARLAHAGDLGSRRTMTGEPLPPILTAVAAAVLDGEISAAHVSVITRCLDAIPPDIACEMASVAERFLVEAARHEHPAALARTAQLLLVRLDPDGSEPRTEELERRRDLTLHSRADGSADIRGLLTPQAAEALRTLLDPLSAPTPGDDGMRDERRAGQRRHDALHDMSTRLLRSGTLPAAGGIPVTILATTTLAELAAGAGAARTGHGEVWSIRQLQQAADEAALVPVVLNGSGGVLAYGRTRRLASRGQRLALIARDGGCCFPGCERPAAWTEVHHIRDWADGGPTDIDNMCLLCRFHHREFERTGWQVRMSDDAVPEWIPPPFVDPDRSPRRNTAQLLRDFAFGGPELAARAQ